MLGHMMNFEHDYSGLDYSINLRGLNPSPTELTGLFMTSYLQSVTKNLALGTELVYQRSNKQELANAPAFSSSYMAKYTGASKNWAATINMQPMGVYQATYWQKINEKVDAAADWTVITMPGKREGVATLGVKYDLRMATFRAQVDSTGKVSALLEQRFAPTFQFLISGEIDHLKV